MRLPKGYYAVQSDPRALSSGEFSYRGVCYEVTPGEDVFATMQEANAHATALPEERLAGLETISLTTPVILLSAGVHCPDKFSFDRSIAILGQGAGISPNLPAPERTVPPAPNPAREGEGETVLRGSYWFGKMVIPEGSGAQSVLLDGFSTTGVSFRDLRRRGEGTVCFTARNIVHLSPCAYMLYFFADPATDGALHREVTFENIRLQNFDDYGYGTNFGLITARKTVMRGIVYDTTEQSFGPSDIPRGKTTCEPNSPHSEITLMDCYFRNLSGYHGVCISSRQVAGRTLDITLERCTFIDACRAGDAPLKTELPDGESRMSVKDCLFVDTRGAECAIAHGGNGAHVLLQGCETRGFAKLLDQAPPLPVDAPDYIENRAESWDSGTADAHRVIGEGEADFSALDALYEGRRAYYGDQHVHTACGGTSDGAYPMDKWVARMDELDVDFAIIVDHRQMRGFFLPEWDEERFVIGTEPGTKITDLGAVRLGMADIHYNMLFPHRYGLAMVLANFPEFEFRGDELTGSFRYPKFTKERFAELTAYVQSIGGMMVHPHPKTMLVSNDPMDYYIGEHTYLETIYGAPGTAATYKNYELWVELLHLGKRIYASSGSDTHGGVSNAALSTFYTKRRHSEEFFARMHSGDYTVGEVGIKMCIDGQPMGSEIPYREGMKLTLRMDDFYRHAWRPNTVYELRIVTDRGVAYASRCNGKFPQAMSLAVQERAFYRAEIYDVSHDVWVAHGNPIWLDRA